MKKIGIFFSLSCYGGVQTCIISLIKGLNEIGIIPDLISDEKLNNKIVQENEIKLNLEPIQFSISKSFYDKVSTVVQGAKDLVYFYRTSRLAKDYDFLYIFQPNVIVDSDVKYLYYLSMSPRSPGFSGRSVLPRLKFFLYDYLIKYFIPVYEFKDRSENCVINSQFTAELFYKAYNKRIEVVYPSNLFTLPERINYSTKSQVLFLLRIVPAKRPEMFLTLSETFPDLQFVLCGAIDDEQYIKSLKELVERKRITNVTFEINQPYSKVVELLSNARYYVFTAKNEHFGITTVEAMMYGAIPFVHNSGGQKEIVPWEELRFEDDEFIRKFEKLLKISPDKTEKLREELYQHVQNFSQETYISMMLAYLPKTLSYSNK